MNALFVYYSLLIYALSIFSTLGHGTEFPDFKENGQVIGNGGDVVVCPEGTASPGVFLLDYYEGEVRYGFDLDLDNLTGSPSEIVRQVIDTLAVDPYRQTKYLNHLDSFFDDSLFLAGVRLVDVADSDHIAVPVGCTIEQVAIQVDPLFPEERRYTINEDLWNQMTNAHKAGLILHEIIYRDAVSVHYHKNSIRTRYLAALLTSRAGDSLSIREYIDLWSRIEFYANAVLYEGFLLKPFTIKFNPQGLPECADFHWDDDFSQVVTIQNQEIDVSFGGRVCFFGDGGIRELEGKDYQRDGYLLEFKIYGPRLSSLPVTLDENGNLVRGRMLEAYHWNAFGHCQVSNEIDDLVWIYETGVVRFIVAAGPIKPWRICHPKLGSGLTTLDINDFYSATFYPNGVLATGSFRTVQTTFIFDRGVEVEVHGMVEFHNSGIPKSAYMARASELYDQFGVKQTFPIGYQAEFDVLGRVVTEQ